jgi:hypothetical protein
MSSRLAVVATLALVLAPTAASQVAPAVDADRLEALGSRAESLQLSAGAGGVARAARGDLALEGDDLAARVASFSTQYGPLFGVEGDVTLGDTRVLGEHLDGAPRHVKLPQLIHGFPLEGHGLVLRFDASGDATLAHGVVSADAAALPAPDVDEAAGARLGRVALAGLGLPPGTTRGEPVTEPAARFVDGVPHLLWRTTAIPSDSPVPLAVDVDAHTGAVVRAFEPITHGGTFSFDPDGAGPAPQDYSFKTTTGKGYAYKKVAHALAEKDTPTPLRELGTGDILDPVAVDGMLTGRYVQVMESDFSMWIDPSYQYLFRDDDATIMGGAIPAYELFDHTNTYVWMQAMGKFITKTYKTNPMDWSVPTLVNFDDGGAGYVNAFFSSADLDGPGFGSPPGYFVFGEFDEATGDVMDDLSRDPSIACHEYVHGAVDASGASFGNGDLDSPERSVNEALADFGASSFLRTPLVGEAFMHHSGADIFLPGEEFMRSLDLPLTMADNLWDTVGNPSGLPEEHEAGEIFANFLWTAKLGLKKAANAAFLPDNLDWPMSSFEVGYPLVTPGNAEDAYQAFYFACVEAIRDGFLSAPKGPLGKKQRLAGHVLGAALAHGLAVDEDGLRWVWEGTGESGLKMKYRSRFLGSIDTHVFDVELTAGQVVTVVAKGDKKTATQMDFTWDAAGGAFTETKPKTFSNDGTKAAQAKIAVNETGTYRLTITNTDAGGGGYALTVKAK